MSSRRRRLAAITAVGAIALAGLTAPAAQASPTTWSQPVANGRYEVTIKHPVAQPQPGQVSVTAEGRQVFAAIDFQWDKTFTTTVTDGRLDITLDGATDLTGFQVFPVLLDPADPQPNPQDPQPGTRTATESRPIANGSYQVTIKHPLANPKPGWVSVTAEGAVVFDSIDLQWDKTFNVVVRDGRLDIAVTGTTDLTGFRVYPLMTAPGPTPPPTTDPTTGPTPTPTPPTTPTGGFPLGPSRSGLPWLSGVRPPGTQGMDSLRQFEAYRGEPLDAVLTYGHQSGYGYLADNDWPVSAYNDFPGKLVYSLPLIPSDRSGSLASIAAGNEDWVWQRVARQLADNGRGDSIIRVGWEFNIPESPWYTTASDAPVWRAAFRRVVQTMRPIVPDAKFEFGFNCGNSMIGSDDRLAPLTLGYPGDDVVDIVGCDGYDWWQTGSTNEAEFVQALRPATSTGFGDVADFARAHGKLIAFAEWGLTGDSPHGHGDNPFYLQRMFAWFTENRDILAVECYFDDPQWMRNSLGWWQLPLSAELYRTLW